MRDEDGVILAVCEVRADREDLPWAGWHSEEAIGVPSLAMIEEKDRWSHIGFPEEGAKGSRMEAA